MSTITRGAVTLSPLVMLGWSMTRPGRAVVHPVLNDPEPDVTNRAPGLRSGTVRCLFATHALAQAAADSLAVPGGPWTFNGSVLTLTASVTGDITVTATDDEGTAWTVDVGVQEVVS